MLAGFAANTVSSPVNGLMPLRAFLAGFFTVTILNSPGKTNSPHERFLIWPSMRSLNSSKTACTSFLGSSVFSLMRAIICVLVKRSLMAVIFLAAAGFAAPLRGVAFFTGMDISFMFLWGVNNGLYV